MILIGCGSQSKYVFEALQPMLDFAVFDPIGGKIGQLFKDFYEIKSIEEADEIKEGYNAAICVADNNLKEELAKRFDRFNFPKIIHPKSIVATDAHVNKGTIVNPGAILQPECEVGIFCMIHSTSVVEHNCILDRFVNIGPGVKLCGHVEVGKKTTIYTGSVVAPTVKIGDNCIIGAGSVVLHDVPNNSRVWGII